MQEREPPDQDEVEITDLDMPDNASKFWLSRSIANSPLSASTRATLIGAGLLSGIIILVLLLQIGSPSAANQISPATSHTSATPASSVVNVAVANGVAYVNAPDGTLSAFRVSDGSLLWYSRSPSLPHAFLVATDHTLYRASYNNEQGFVDALQTDNGALLWRTRVPLPGPQPLIVRDGVVYVNTQEGTVYALRASDGAQRWHYASGQHLPLGGFLSVADGVVIILSQDMSVHILRADNGSEILHYRNAAQGTSGLPQVAHGMLYVSPRNGLIEAIRLSDDKWLWQHSTSIFWFATAADGIVYMLEDENDTGQALLALRDADGSLLWSYRTKAGFAMNPLVQNNIVYLALQDTSLVALRTSNGSFLWRFQTPARPQPYWPALMVADNIVYTSSTTLDGTVLYALRDNDGGIIWHQKVGPLDLDDPPMIANGVLAIPQADGSIDGWRANDGSYIWHYTVSAPILRYPQVVDGGILYIRLLNGTMDVVRLRDGLMLWRYPLNL